MTVADFTRPAGFFAGDDVLVVETVGRMMTRYAEDRDADGLWEALASSGFTELLGPGPGDLDATAPTHAAVVAEEAGRRLCHAPVVSGALLSPALLRQAELDDVGRAVVDGTEPLALLVTADLSSVRLTGTDPVAWDAGSSRRALGVFGERLCVVELGEATGGADLTRGGRRPAGEPRPVGRLAGDAAARIDDLGRILLAADSLGAAEELLGAAVAYSRARVQFGAPIAAFQAIQHLCAEALVQIEGLRSCVYYAAWAYGAGHHETPRAAAVAKAYATEAARAAVTTSTQVFGGTAILWEHDAHRALRRVLANGSLFGDERAIRRELGR